MRLQWKKMAALQMAAALGVSLAMTAPAPAQDWDEWEYDAEQGLNEQEWYDPTDWFDNEDGVDYESDDFDWDWDWDEGYYEDDWFEANSDYDYYGAADYEVGSIGDDYADAYAADDYEDYWFEDEDEAFGEEYYDYYGSYGDYYEDDYYDYYDADYYDDYDDQTSAYEVWDYDDYDTYSADAWDYWDYDDQFGYYDDQLNYDGDELLDSAYNRNPYDAFAYTYMDGNDPEQGLSDGWYYYGNYDRYTDSGRRGYSAANTASTREYDQEKSGLDDGWYYYGDYDRYTNEDRRGYSPTGAPYARGEILGDANRYYRIWRPYDDARQPDWNQQRDRRIMMTRPDMQNRRDMRQMQNRRNLQRDTARSYPNTPRVNQPWYQGRLEQQRTAMNQRNQGRMQRQYGQNVRQPYNRMQGQRHAMQNPQYSRPQMHSPNQRMQRHAMQNQRNGQGRSDQRSMQHSMQMARVGGAIDQISRVQDPAKPDHTVLKIRFRNGQTVVTDFGPMVTKQSLPLDRGDKIEIVGQPQQRQGQRIIVVNKLRLDGRTYNLRGQPDHSAYQRQQQYQQPMMAKQPNNGQAATQTASINGRITDANKLWMSNDQHTLIQVCFDNGQERILAFDKDINLNDLNLADGDRLHAEGRRTMVRGEHVLTVEKLMVNGDQLQLTRR